RVWRLDHLGLLANHPRWWRASPNDQDWFGLPDEGRRLLRREGTRHAFEPNDAILRRTVERTMTLHLDDLFRRGAFAGAAPASAYQVLVEDQESIGGRFHEERLIVELRVAPSRPLEFLTVRLTQWGGVGQLTEGR
ncbi:MAG: hypothetical protein ACK5EA_23730, partial [Planctomycetaceae bacterium]